MANCKFKVGQRVTYRNPQHPRTAMNWAMHQGLQLGETYEVIQTTVDGRVLPRIKVRLKSGSRGEFWIDDCQFEAAKTSNEERVKLRLEKLNA